MRRRRWRSASKPTKGRRRWVLVVILLSGFLMLQSFFFVEKNLRTPLLNIASVRVKQKATEAINEAITDKIAQGSDIDKLVNWQKDSTGRISGFMLNYAEHMKIAGETIHIVQTTLQNLQRIPEQIPLGMAFKSNILGSFGPNIPIRLIPAGDVKADLQMRQKDAGINMLLVEVYIRVAAQVAIIIPFNTKPETVTTEIPISYLLVVGDVPMYYFDGKGNPVGGKEVLPPNVSLPGVTERPGQ